MEELRPILTINYMVCRHSSVDSSAPTIQSPRVQVPSMPSMLLSFIVKFVLYLLCEKNRNKQKEAGFGPFLKQSIMILMLQTVWQFLSMPSAQSTLNFYDRLPAVWNVFINFYISLLLVYPCCGALVSLFNAN